MRRMICVLFVLILMGSIVSCGKKHERNIVSFDELPSELLGGTARIYTEHKSFQGLDYVSVVTEEYDAKHIDFSEEYVSNLKIGDVVECDPDFSVVVTKYERDDSGVMNDYTDNPARRPGIIFIADEWYFRHNNEKEGDPDRWQLVNTVTYFDRVYEYSGDAVWIPLSDNCRIIKAENFLTEDYDDKREWTLLDRDELFDLLDELEDTTGRSYISGEYWTMNNKVIEIVLLMDDHR